MHFNEGQRVGQIVDQVIHKINWKSIFSVKWLPNKLLTDKKLKNKQN